MSDTQSATANTSRGALSEGDRYLALLAIVLLGYALMGKGFAYLGFPPLYVGEIALLTGIVVFLRIGAFAGALATLPALLLVALMAWVLARTLPFVGAVRVRVPARQRRRDLRLFCLLRDRVAAGGCSPDQHGASLLRDHAGELPGHSGRLLVDQILGGLHPATIRSGADRGDRSERGRNASCGRHGFRPDRLSQSLSPLDSCLVHHARSGQCDQSWCNACRHRAGHDRDACARKVPTAVHNGGDGRGHIRGSSCT